MQIRQSLFQLLQFPECLFQVTLKDANWETSMETRPCQWRCPLSEISLCSLKLWSGCMRLSKCVEKNIFLWCNCICELAFHLAGTRFEVHGPVSPCGSKALSITRSSESCCHVSVVKMNAAGTYKRTENTNMLWKCACLPIRNTVGLPAVLLPGSLSRRLMTDAEASPRACGEGKEGGGVGGGTGGAYKNPPKKHARTPSACGCTSGVSSQSADNPPDTTNSTDLHNRAASLTDYSNPSKFYLSNSLSSLRRREAGNKTSGLKGSSPALPHSLLLIAPLSPSNPQPPTHPPLLLCLSPSYSI